MIAGGIIPAVTTVDIRFIQKDKFVVNQGLVVAIIRWKHSYHQGEQGIFAPPLRSLSFGGILWSLSRSNVGQTSILFHLFHAVLLDQTSSQRSRKAVSVRGIVVGHGQQ